MHFSTIALPLAMAAAAMATTCKTPVGSGTCGYTSSACSGGGYIAGFCPGPADFQCCVKGVGGPLPGLDETQSANCRKVIEESDALKLGKQGCLAGVTTGLTESAMLVYANNAVPASFNYPHNAVGDNYDSLGIFQQRYIYYPNVAADMSPSGSAKQFYDQMVAIKGWETMYVPTLCQDVQKSADPEAYVAHYAAAEKICAAVGY